MCDVTDEAQVQSLFDEASTAAGGIDVVVNNAGLGGTADVVDMTDEQWTKVLDVTLNGTFRCTRAALRHFRRARRRRDREQRVGARLARAGRSGALRRGEGRRDGAHAVRGDRGAPSSACGSTRSRRASPCTRSWRR